MNVSRTKLAIFIGAAVAVAVVVLALGVIVTIANRHSAPRFEFKAMHAPPFAHSAIITDETDKFTGERTVALQPMAVTPEASAQPLQLRAFFLKPRNGKGRPDAVVMTFSSVSKEWRFLKYHPLRILVDGSTLEVPPSHHDGDVVGSNAMEWISVDLPLSKFFQIANAESVEVRLGGEEMRLTAEHMEALRDLLSRAIIEQ